MVEPLADKPPETSPDAWLVDIAKTANTNPHIHEESLILNDRPALKVRYRTQFGHQMEALYVVSGTRTIEVAFSGDLRGHGSVEALEAFENYQIYLKMLQTFKVLSR